MSTLEIPETFPYAHQLGLRVIDEENNGFRFELPSDPRFIGNPVISAFHGGIICGAMSSAMMFTVARMNDLETHPELVNQTTSFLSSASAEKNIFFQTDSKIDVVIEKFIKNRQTRIPTVCQKITL